MQAGIRHHDDVGNNLRRAESFIVGEKEDFVLLDRTADTAAVLIAAEIRWLRCGGPGEYRVVEEVARFHHVVAQVVIRRTVDRVRARLARSVDDGAVAAELRTVSVGQSLKLGNGFHAKRRAEATCARAVQPEVDHVLIVQQIGLAGGTGTGNRVLLSVAIKCAAGARCAQGNLSHARGQNQ